MDLTPPPEPTEPPARTAVRDLFLEVHRELQRRAEIHKPGFARVWRSGTHTAAEFFEEAGDQAGLFMTIAGQNVQHISTVAQSIGRTLHDYLQPADYVPPQAYTIHEDGTVTIDETP